MTRTSAGEFINTNNVVNVSASTTAASGTIGGVAGTSGDTDVYVSNQTNGWAFFTFADVAANLPTATVSNGIPVPPGTVRVFSLPGTAQIVSVILAAGATSGNVGFVRGLGI